ncbi:phosphopentomutase [Pectinatus brassicae]|uniref:Phosphopentomutase n=2 Tax=Pectinatus brassicae TaxID=862415 RepID=A0A840UGU3_9FIRM|nr:phosphopentomutase [Pectinatus brassicae]MBB5336229.1 phosphopentomutase [Pectinatus brassicae]
MAIKRVYTIVLDSYGIGAQPDAAEFGDNDCNTLRSIVSSPLYDTPNMKKIGLFNIDDVDYKTSEAQPTGSFARLQERSRGKDTTTGHWEIAGIVSEHPLPTYPQGFPQSVINELEQAFNRKILCNKTYSGTQVIEDYGQEHMKTGSLIVYTSADSVLQIAAHEDIVPVEQLYEYCRMARKIMSGEHAVGRIIARPFVGTYPDFKRTARRHDFSLQPPAETMLDVLHKNNLATIGVGKISDIFAACGISKHIGITGNEDGMDKTIATLDDDFTGLCFVNLVDFDMQYGHRRDVDGYAQAATVFDKQLGEFMAKMNDDDILMITADHGCDPKAPGTDHTREYTPLLIWGKQIKAGVNLGTRNSFADIAATVIDIFDLDLATQGKSFLEKIM